MTDLTMRTLFIIPLALLSAAVVSLRAAQPDTSPRRLIALTDGRDRVTLSGRVERPRLWSPSTPEVCRVHVEVLRGGAIADLVTEPAVAVAVQRINDRARSDSRLRSVLKHLARRWRCTNV